MRQHQASVEAITVPLPGARLLLLRCPALAQAGPGQFVMLRCGSGLDPYLRQAVPIHRLLDDGIALLVRPENASLRWLTERRPGDWLDLYGPCGRGFDLPGPVDTLAVVAQGSGWIPVAALLDRAPCPVQLLVAAPTAGQLPPRELVPTSVEYVGHVGTETDVGWSDLLRDAVRWSSRLALAAASDGSGGAALYRQVTEMMRASPAGLRRGRGQAWLWGELTCGLGVCDGCLVETRHGWRRVCSDGPVFDLADLALA